MERQAKDGTIYQQVGQDEWAPVTRTAKDGTVFKKVGADSWAPAEAKPAKAEAPERKLEAAIEGFGEGATLGYLNNIQAAIEKPVFAALNAVTGQNVEADDYVKARDYYNKRQAGLQKENPGSFTAGQVAGTIASSVPVARAAQGATALARAAQGAKAGAIYGGLQNTAEQEGQLGGLDVGQRIGNAAVGAALGGASSLGADAAAKGLSAAGAKFANTKNKLGNFLKKGAEDLAENATGATRVQAEKFGDDSGRYLLDNKIVGFGDNVDDVARKANEQISKAERGIDSSLKKLDAKDVQVSQDNIVATLQTKIQEMSKDSSKADVVKKLNSIIDDIINTGESNLSAGSAEKVKRGYNKMAKNWQDPEKGEAGKIAYQAYRDAVETTAQAADPKLAKLFKDSKSTFGKLAPIATAAEKRAIQLNQSPIGGLLDTAAVIGGAMGGNDPLSGGAMGIGAALARRKFAPRASSSMAVTFDKISQQLLKNPEMKQMAQVNPQAFKATVFSFVKDMTESKGPSGMPMPATAEAPKKGPEKWANDGKQKLIEHDPSLDAASVDALMKTKKGKDLLIRASDLKPKSKAMEKLKEQIRSASLGSE